MDASTACRRAEFGIPGRYTVTVECADDLTDDEIIMMPVILDDEMARFFQPA